MERHGITRLSYIYIYIHVFVCDLAKGADACYTQKNLGKHTRELTAERERERERPVMLDYHIYINLCVCLCDGQRQAQ